MSAKPSHFIFDEGSLPSSLSPPNAFDNSMSDFPQVPGPKIKQFNLPKVSLVIDFINHLGKGIHAHVWKVRINGGIYALKIFNFHDKYHGAKHWHLDLSQEEELAYLHPFGCEARAYGRLQELGVEANVGLRCFGYLILKDKHFQQLRSKDKFDWSKDWGYSSCHRERPVYALVKEYIDIPSLEGLSAAQEAEINVTPKTAAKLIHNVKTIHRSGIMIRDINTENVFKGKMIEFSVAWTVPHPCLTKRILNDHDLLPWWQQGSRDAGQVDRLIKNFNETHETEKIWLRMTRNHEYMKGKLRRTSQYFEGKWNREGNRGYRIWPERYKWKPGLNDVDQGRTGIKGAPIATMKIPSRKYGRSKKAS